MASNIRPYDAAGRYLVTSERDITTSYVVDLLAYEGEGECSCDDWTHRIGGHLKAGTTPPRRFCKHIESARAVFVDAVIRRMIEVAKKEGRHATG